MRISPAAMRLFYQCLIQLISWPHLAIKHISAVGPSHDGGQTDRHDIAESILISEALSIIMQCVPTLGLGHNNSVSYHGNTTWHHLRTFCPPLNIPFQQ